MNMNMLWYFVAQNMTIVCRVSLGLIGLNPYHVTSKSWFKSNQGPLQYVISLSISLCLLSLPTAINQSDATLPERHFFFKIYPVS